MMRAAFGLGGNIGNVVGTLQCAVQQLCALPYADETSLQQSPLYVSAAHMPDDAPEAWNQDFINQVVTLDVQNVAPDNLLQDVKHIEVALGRKPAKHWAPRVIDIDIIAIDGVTYDSEILHIPHHLAHTRAFVIKPLAAIWPDCVIAGKRADNWLNDTDIVSQKCEPLNQGRNIKLGMLM